jgi:hypothetical protein
MIFSASITGQAGDDSRTQASCDRILRQRYTDDSVPKAEAGRAMLQAAGFVRPPKEAMIEAAPPESRVLRTAS